MLRRLSTHNALMCCIASDVHGKDPGCSTAFGPGDPTEEILFLLARALLAVERAKAEILDQAPRLQQSDPRRSVLLMAATPHLLAIEQALVDASANGVRLHLMAWGREVTGT